ncbi:hypothetical protein AA11826_1131 [Komagataeibacter oboediens DSM 11826]|nr:hypothetical protein AA11826_1131 [Komagataeibacter oboediens DSM 11826]
MTYRPGVISLSCTAKVGRKAGRGAIYGPLEVTAAIQSRKMHETERPRKPAPVPVPDKHAHHYATPPQARHGGTLRDMGAQMASTSRNRMPGPDMRLWDNAHDRPSRAEYRSCVRSAWPVRGAAV